MSDAYERRLNANMDPDFPNVKLKNGDIFQPRVQARDFYKKKNPFNLKYPSTVGEDFNTATNYNSNSSSQYAKSRLADENSGIKKDAMEPFVFFEFMEITPKKKLDRLENMGEAGKKARNLTAGPMKLAGSANNKDPNDLAFQGTYYSLLQDYMPDGISEDSNPHSGSTMRIRIF